MISSELFVLLPRLKFSTLPEASDRVLAPLMASTPCVWPLPFAPLPGLKTAVPAAVTLPPMVSDPPRVPQSETAWLIVPVPWSVPPLATVALVGARVVLILRTLPLAGESVRPPLNVPPLIVPLVAVTAPL